MRIGIPFGLGLSCLVYDGPGHLLWRSHGGDAFVVAFLIGLLGLIPRLSFPRRATGIALLCAGLEFAQLQSGSAHRRGIEAIVLGTHFDPLDFLFYAAGIALALLLNRRSEGMGPRRDCHSEPG